jgi:hypothetical protein
MILSQIILITVVSSVLDWFTNLKTFDSAGKIEKLMKRGGEDEFLYKKIRRLRYARYFQISFMFLLINAFGAAFGVGLLFNATDIAPDLLTIMKGLYWAVQSTTTIGYGDVNDEFTATVGQRTLNVFYLVLSTGFVAYALGKLSSLSGDLADARLRYTWGRRNVAKALISEIQGDGDDVNEYQFVVASLVQLNMVKTDDIKDIMDRFRVLSDGEETFSAADVMLNQQPTEKEIRNEAKKGSTY